MPNDKLQDELLDKFVGSWHIVREFKNRKVDNRATVSWVLDHQFLRIDMIDVNEPPQYEAHVYIGFDATKSLYVCHWIDVFGGEYSSRGFGERESDSIRISFDDDLINTFAYHPDNDSWTSKIDQRDKTGNFVPFCFDTYMRVK